MTKKSAMFCFLLVLMLFAEAAPAHMQAGSGELAATLEVISSGVEVRRVNTINWIAVRVEAVVGVGDIIRTDETGKARITFFADGVDTEIQPGSEFQINRFESNGGGFRLSASVLLGQSIQRIRRLLDADSSYDIQTPGMDLSVRGTEFIVRVEPGGRSAALVFEGTAVAAAEERRADVGAGYGVRSAADGGLSDVVLASTFDQLDSALDGCTATVRTLDDVRLNVRLGPSRDFPRVGTIDATEISRLMGISEAGGWYRIEFRGGFGWVLASDITLDEMCAGLRIFSDAHIEDLALYEALGETIKPEDLNVPTATPTPAEPADQGSS